MTDSNLESLLILERWKQIKKRSFLLLLSWWILPIHWLWQKRYKRDFVLEKIPTTLLFKIRGAPSSVCPIKFIEKLFFILLIQLCWKFRIEIYFEPIRNSFQSRLLQIIWKLIRLNPSESCHRLVQSERNRIRINSDSFGLD